ncbi:electron transport complex protein RnfG [Acetitomaculum ruminis DSM 5522]|uniref:Ion-translocating oxidoreductase complex subunit G n=1 Tax=Acetitomaculum ruminis DSM 5522 TaxID=1120918 RepID=A0A1I1A4G9_9FIRM|nr:RnfABCDGE type electron transport complex subunit G [Acetitomaculum ruminis]SFB32924.1 electron transport complex protein RnfG [Acetitomaculum ruminis DSM 5522]
MKEKNTIVKDAIILLIITVVAGSLLGAVYQITKEPIKQANIAATNKAYALVYADADTFEDVDVDYDDVNAKILSGGIDNGEVTEVKQAVDGSGTALGYVLSVNGLKGYGGSVGFTIGVTLEGEVTGIEILSCEETPGLGQRCKEEAFRNQYVGKAVDGFKVTKAGASADDEIDAISGATITSTCVTGGVNAALYYVKNLVQ